MSYNKSSTPGTRWQEIRNAHKESDAGCYRRSMSGVGPIQPMVREGLLARWFK